jgi:phenylpropionate dioxygenase-like ring-hydroxylating dioxygenase large terminal subunit
MAVLDHWHPILLSSKLRAEPVGVRLGGKDIVLFRAGPGQIGALDDCCVHRRMRLSKGCVVNGRLRCRYHGWSFDTSGAGESPGTPKLQANTASYDTAERLGAIWIKAAGSAAAFPTFVPQGYYHLCTLHHQVKAPLEVAVDNFTEIEHTPTTHAVFGYDLERMSEVEVRFEPTDTSVRVINHGPQKRLSPVLRLLMGVRRGDFFNDDWTTFFSPVYSIYDHWWSSPDQQRQGKIRWRIVIFFNEIDDAHTGLMTFAYTKSSYPGPAGGVRLFKPWLIHMLDKEVRLDVDILENLADQSPSIEGMKLSRFDRVLGLNRERIERIYRGKPAAAVPASLGTVPRN